MKVVIAGASGFLGQALLRRLSGTDAAIVPVTRRSLPGMVHVADYGDTPAGDVLVYLAGSAQRVESSFAQETDQAQQHRAMLETLAGKPYRRFVYASSAVLYGDAASTPRSPDDEIHVVDAYTRVKRCGELAVLDTGFGAVARLTNLFGPGMSTTNVVSTILQQIPGAGDLQVRDAAPVRDFLWVDDAADALARMAVGHETGIFNVGTGKGTSIGAVARLALDIAGEGKRQVFSTRPDSRQSQLVLDISQTEAVWRWLPTTTVDAGLARLLQGGTAQRHE